MTEAKLRALTPADGPALRTATLGNLNWSGTRFTVTDLDTTPVFAHYTRLDPERGDFGVAAELDGQVVGVAWALFLPSTDPGFGFIAADIPELSLWVAAPNRGQGLGRRLLRAIQGKARQRHLTHLSLSVEEGNGARRLYEQERFVDVPDRRAEGVMLWTAGCGARV